ncbi:MAG: NAD(P)/FAD-dependent oxidoreductase [Butyrivibrio sp.]|nr:NAD(P)/FAD-dependent oxidoreductase [Acetatifactor muris]MCM1560523.1 NAD(P)/FAD-dependent oxidoreductase [Butyrivibrio sp.]
MRRTIGVVGGGAAGMTAAILAAGNGADVTVLEGNDRVGKKILSTGNGRCNLGNESLSPEMYSTRNPERLKGWLEQFGTNDTVEFFRTLGLLTKVKNGGLYPVSEQASSVLDALRFELARQQRIHVRTGCRVERIRRDKTGNHILLEGGGEKFSFDRVILACGGRAAPKTGSDGSGYRLAEMLGHSLVPVVPALVQLKCREDWFPSVAGVRADGAMVPEDAGAGILPERGELQFTDYGISGIPVFQISGRINYILREKREVVLKIDFFPDDEKEGFPEKLMRTRLPLASCGTVEEYFTGVLNRKLMTLFIRLAGLRPSEPAAQADPGKIRRVYELCRELKVHVTGSNSFEHAQVCAGGVPLDELTERLESAKTPGVFFAGEILDVDGRCGGYNLQWAWCSGYLAGVSAAAFAKSAC